MNRLEFVASLVSSIAWPTVVITVVILFKEAIILRLSSLSKFKYNKLEMEFKERLNHIEDELKDEVIQPTFTGGGGKDEMDILALANIYPNAVVVNAWHNVEKVLHHLASETPNASVRKGRIAPRVNVNSLKKNGTIDDSMAKTLEELMFIRNNAVNAHPSENIISYESAIRYHDLSERVIALLEYENANK